MTEQKDFTVFFPLTKVVELDDGTVKILARGTQEVKDAAGEVMDYDSTVPEIQAWSNQVYKRSQGKSYGNVRSMHQPIATGLLNAPPMYKDDEKAVDLSISVVDVEEIKKVKAGVYTGISMGGSYKRRWFDPMTGVTKYTGKPSEFSLVDAPCVPTAVFQMVKLDGTTEMRKFRPAVDPTKNNGTPIGWPGPKTGGPLDPDPIASGEGKMEVQPGDDQAARQVSADHGVETIQKTVTAVGENGPVLDTIENGEVVTPVTTNNVQATEEISASHGVEVAGVKRTDEPAAPDTSWLDKFQATVHELSAVADKLDLVQKAEAAEKDKALNELKARGSRVGIARREGEPLTPPADYPTDPAVYADPANWKFPCDSKHAVPAVGYYNNGSARSKYSPREWATLGRRITALASKSTGTPYVFSAEEKKINRKEVKKMNDTTLAKGTDVNSLLADLKSAVSGAIEEIQKDPQKAQDLLMQAISAVDVASDVAKPASTGDASPHAPTSDAKVDTLKAAGAAPTPGAGPDKPMTDGSGTPPQTPQLQSSSSSSSSPSSQDAAYSKLEKQVNDLAELVKAVLKKDEPAAVAGAVPAATSAKVEELDPATGAPVKKNLPAGDLQAIVGGGSTPQQDLLKLMTSDPETGLAKAVKESGLSVQALQNMSQEAVIHMLVDDGRISAKTHQVYNAPI